MIFNMYRKIYKQNININRCWLGRPGTMTHLFLKAMSTPGAQTVVSKYIPHEKRLEFHQKISDYKTRAGNGSRNDSINLNISCAKRNEGFKNKCNMSKELASQLEEVSSRQI